MKTGTKSVLCGYHAFWLHPWLVAWGWVKLYGWTWDPRIWVAFFVHDLGYIGSPDMDGVQGKQHPFLGASIMHFLFDYGDSAEWYQFSLYHSRSLVRLYFAKESRLCFADKLAFSLYPIWLLKTLYWLSGEGKEYLNNDWSLSVKSDGFANFDEWYEPASEGNRQSLIKEGLTWK